MTTSSMIHCHRNRPGQVNQPSTGPTYLSQDTDPYLPARLALSVNPLACGRLDPLSDTEQTSAACLVAEPLLDAWGGPTPPRPGRSGLVEQELARLGILAEHPAVVAAAAAGAVGDFLSGPAGDRYKLGRRAIDVLDRHHHPVPLALLRMTASAAIQSGEGAVGQDLLDRGLTTAETAAPSCGATPCTRTTASW